jgi:glucosamine-6-phosphate deaminase
MDEYIGLPDSAPQAFGNFLVDKIFGKVAFKSVNLIDSSSTPEAECARYSELLRSHPCDIVVMGIGENGHIAFNDPPVADFSDPEIIKPVKLDEICRNQQVHDGCFEKLSDVPTHALTLTCPTLMSAKYKFCIVPAPTKANAVYDMLNTEVSVACPATILRKSENAVLYLDADSSAKL